MKTFKDFEAFKKRIQSAPAWDDYFTMGGRMYKLYEYGDADGANYVYFVNKKTHDAIRVQYVCPSTQWVKIPEVCEEDGKPHAFTAGTLESGWIGTCVKCLRREREQVQTRVYRFIEAEFIEDMDLWRTDTL